MKDGKGVLDTDVQIIIWTTTPWTIPANLGISVHPELKYVVVETDGQKYLVAQEFLKTVSEEIGWENPSVVTNS